MKAFELSAPGLQHLVLRDLPDPHARAGQVVIRQRAASLNYLDVAVANGRYPKAVYPNVPVADGAGVVVEVGPDVRGWAVGDRVVPHFKPAWRSGPVGPAANEAMRGVTTAGALAEYAVASATSLVRTPDHLDDAEAATLPIAATTAWNALESIHAKPGDTVLLLGTGGVSIIALQLAKARGARVIVTSSSDDKLERARALGADETINYRREPEWQHAVRERTGGDGVHLVVESGGSDTFGRSIASTRWGGTIFLIGFLSGGALQFDGMPVIEHALRIQGNNTGSVADLASAVAAIDAHRIRPVVDRVFDWTDARDAYAYAASAGRFGKVALSIPG